MKVQNQSICKPKNNSVK